MTLEWWDGLDEQTQDAIVDQVLDCNGNPDLILSVFAWWER